MDKLRIVCLPDGLPVDYTIQFANSLSKKAEVMLVLQNTPQLFELEELLENVDNDVFVYISKKVEYPIWNPKNIFIFSDIIREMRRFKPDIIHVQNGDIVSVLSYPFVRKAALITTFHDVHFNPGQKTIINRIVRYCSIKKSKMIFVHGKKLKTLLMEKDNIPDNKICTIPIGEHNVAPFNKYINNNIKCDNSILFFGWIGIRKGLEYLIKAEHMILKEVPEIKIIIAGRMGHPEEYSRKLLNTIVHNTNFEIYPHYISWEFGAELFQRSSIVVLPYIEVSQSGVISTAYGFKKPVVVTDVGALSEIVDDGVTGFVVPSKDSQALADALIKLLKSEKLREELGENAYKKLKTDLSWDNITEATIEVYKKVIKEIPCK